MITIVTVHLDINTPADKIQSLAIESICRGKSIMWLWALVLVKFLKRDQIIWKPHESFLGFNSGKRSRIRVTINVTSFFPHIHSTVKIWMLSFKRFSRTPEYSYIPFFVHGRIFIQYKVIYFMLVYLLFITRKWLIFSNEFNIEKHDFDWSTSENMERKRFFTFIFI